MDLTIKTNNHQKPLMSFFDLSENEKKEAISKYCGDVEKAEQDDYFIYKGFLYNIGDFMSPDKNSPLKEWDGYQNDSYSSGVVIKLSPDCDSVVPGWFCS